ncbi:MAG: beta-lactamase family protein [Myxococcales bacterium]|nr:beta-lactamase family protein [Myxococcales bacterium]
MPRSPSVDLSDVARLVVDRFRAAPAAAIAASFRGRCGLGASGALEPGSARPASVGTPFDLASVTKPVVALTLARLVRQQRIALSEPLEEVLPDLRGTFAGRVPVELFAAHRSGLAAHIELFAPLREGHPVDKAEAIRRAAESRRPECEGPAPAEGFPPIYSDMGYLLLGLAVEARGGEPLDAVVTREVTAPLGLADRVGSARQMRAQLPSFDAEVAPTEDVEFRGGVVRGVVHDENAWALFDAALAGHAGLFGDAPSVLSIGEAILRALGSDDGWLGPRDLEPLVRARPGGTLRAGFDGRSDASPSSGSRLGPRTFGHLGFTGTSLWIDPDAQFAGVLLTNRVHPTRAHVAIREARPAAYDGMFTALERG